MYILAACVLLRATPTYYPPAHARMSLPRVSCCSSCMQIRVWNMRTRAMLAHMKLHGARINQLQLLSDDNHLLSACEDHSLSAWDVNTQKCRATWRLSTPMRGVAACPDQVGTHANAPLIHANAPLIHANAPLIHASTRLIHACGMHIVWGTCKAD